LLDLYLTGWEPATTDTQLLRSPAAAVGDGVAQLSERLRVTGHEASEIFEVDDGEVQLIFAPSRLPRQKAAAMRIVALLTAAARQATGIDEGWTPVEVIRERCREYGVLDSANFASEISHMADVFGFKGSGRNRQVRVNLRGFELAGDRVRDLITG
jgi:hypothetical protein